MTYTEFAAEIKAGLPASLYLLTGPEDFLKEKCIEQAKKKLVAPGFEDFNFQSYSDVPDFGVCADFVNGLPMMSDRKLLVLRRCGFFDSRLKGKADWMELFSALPPSVCVLLWEPDSEKKSSKKKTAEAKKKKPSGLRELCENVGVMVDFQLQPESKLVPWLARAAANGGKLIDRGCASYMIASLGRSMGVLKTEMEKIAAYAAGEQITRADIDAVIIRPEEDRVFKFIDSILDGRRDLSFGYLAELRQNQAEPRQFLSTLYGQLITVYRAKLLLGEGYQRGAVTKKLGVAQYVAEKSVAKAARVSEEGLEGLISLCRDADRDIKSGKVEVWTALDLIVAQARVV